MGEGEEKRRVNPQNRFEILLSRVIQCGVEEKTIRKQELKMFQVQGGGIQVQGVSSMERSKKDDSRRKCSTCGNATKGTAKRRRIEEESGICLTMESIGALWGGNS